MTQTQCSYEGPEIATLPQHVVSVIRGLQEKLPTSATVELIVSQIDRDECTRFFGYDPTEFKAIHVSDDRGLVQSVLYNGNTAYAIRIIGQLPKGAREEAVGYNQTNLETLLTPEQYMEAQRKTGMIFELPWLVEGERK